MKDLAIVTATRGYNNEWIEQCVDSVRANLPPGVEHHILTCPSKDHYLQVKLDSLKLAKYIIYVDDDDIVINDSLRRCYEAVKEHKVAVAFTDDMLIDAAGKTIEQLPIRENLTYRDAATNVKTIHHATIFDTECVPSQLSELLSAVPVVTGVDWMITTSSALVGGAVHVPIHGYQWRIHSHNQHRTPNEYLHARMHIYRGYLSSLINSKTTIKSIGI